MGRFWWPSVFDATLGFPGEGPRAAWLHLASQVLNGGAVFEGQPWIPEALSSDGIHDLLMGIALKGNSIRPIAARVQSRPDRVVALLGEDTPPPLKRSGGARITSGNGPTRYDGHDRFALRPIRCERHRQRSTGCGRSAAQ